MKNIIIISMVSLFMGCATTDMSVVKILSDRIETLESDLADVKEHLRQEYIRKDPAEYKQYLELKRKYEIDEESQ